MKRGFGKVFGQSQHKLISISNKEFAMAHRKIAVRGLPVQNVSSSARYWHARDSIENKLGGERDSWIEEHEDFAKLHQVEYNPNSALVTQLNKHIEDYLGSVGTEFKKQQAQSNAVLNSKLSDYKQQWMREYSGGDPDEIVLSGLEPEEVREAKKTYDKAVKTLKREHSPAIDATPGSSSFLYFSNCIRLLAANKTICFCLDAEAFEFDTDMVTEIGISIYDPRENIFSSIPITRNYHIIISEALTMRNTKFVCDSKDCYQLGESLVLPLNECVEFVQNLINFYLKPNGKEDRSWSRAFVGHNVQGDITWLKQMGIEIPTVAGKTDNLDYQLCSVNKSKEPNEPIFVLDTEKLYRFTYGNKGGNLGKLLRLLRIPHSFLHNAGNDAYYTLQLLLRMCDINYRKQNGLDDIAEMSLRIEQWIKREREEPKVLPMSYSATVKMFEAAPNKRESQYRNKKKTKNIVHQTEFGGSQWYPTARDAFKSTLR